MVPLGIEGNELVVKAYCKITPQEKVRIIEAIMQQKVGANAKHLKQFTEFQKAKEQDQAEGNQEARFILVKKQG